MGKMGRYCKAYPLARLREFSSWREDPNAFRKEGEGVEEPAPSSNGGPANDDHIVYLQENYTVTDGIFIDEHIIFAGATPEWKDFCQQTLNFEIPESATAGAGPT